MSGRWTLISALAALALTGCNASVGRSSVPGTVEHDTQAIELDKAEMVRVEMRMGAGELNVGGGSPRLLDAEFEFDNPGLKPVVRYAASSFRGRLSIEQPNVHGVGSTSHYQWKLRLNNRVPVDVVTHLGAGNAELNLGDLDLRGVEVHMGVGNLDMDLRGAPKRDYNVEIHGAVGNASVRLPSGAGIVAEVKGGIGNIDVQGLEKRNGRWMNAKHEDGKVTIHLDIRGGVGNITLLAN
jgi:N-terminal domain of toast_rack, DUF2154